MFDHITLQLLLHHISRVLELSKFTFGYYRCSILADYLFNIELRVFLTNLFDFLPETGLHLISPHHPLNKLLSRLILLPLLFGCQSLVPLLQGQLLRPQLPTLLQLPLSDQSLYPLSKLSVFEGDPGVEHGSQMRLLSQGQRSLMTHEEEDVLSHPLVPSVVRGKLVFD